jgi:DNA repair exonuclease SbcCD ATPase subunit
MKNETDLQQTIDQLLPPKPVFLSTMFLLQDAQNIFEMQPADRLTVLKNVFGLLGIDEAKEQVQDKKRELSYKLKALQDQSQQDIKLRKLLKQLLNNYTNINSILP